MSKFIDYVKRYNQWQIIFSTFYVKYRLSGRWRPLTCIPEIPLVLQTQVKIVCSYFLHSEIGHKYPK